MKLTRSAVVLLALTVITLTAGPLLATLTDLEAPGWILGLIGVALAAHTLEELFSA